ncbi:MAG: cysteine desulfurase [Bacilli bacterium]
MFNVDDIRKDFPVLSNSKTIYLDNAATTYKPQVVIDAVTHYLTMETSNSGRGDYHDAYLVDQKVLETRQLVQSFIHAKHLEEVIFTSGTTMSLNMIAQGFGARFLKAGDEVILSIGEHASNTLPWFDIAEKTGAKIIFMDLAEDGSISPEILERTMSPRTKVVAINHISNVVGQINDVKKLAAIAHQQGAIIVVDGAQSVPHIKTDVQALDIDFLAFSGHKMLAPTGVGVLYGKRALLDQMSPYLTGGGNNHSYDKSGHVNLFGLPQKFEAGTLNLEAIYGFNAALKYLSKIGLENIAKHELELRSYAIQALKEMPHIVLYNENAHTGIITLNVKGVHAQDAATYFNSKNIAVRSGQHCAKVLKTFLHEDATVRASIYLYTTKEDIDAFIEAARTAEDFLDAYF